jgi:beta-glucosidase
VQLYVRHPSSKVERPRRDLRGYVRVSLRAGETKTVRMRLPARALAYWNPDTDAWVVETGPVEIEVGASSADIRLRQTIQVTGS